MAKFKEVIPNKTIIIKDKVYLINIHLVVGSYGYYSKYIKNSFNITATKQEYYGGHLEVYEQLEKGNYFHLLWLPKLTLTLDNWTAIAHEVLHHCLRAFERLGVKVDFDNQEPLTYYFEYMYVQVMNELAKMYDRG